MKYFWRKIIAGFGICALLFAQLAVAAYACPTPPNGQATAMTKAASNDQDKVKPCHDMDKAWGNLCKQHCEQTSQSVGTNLPTAIDAPVLLLIATILPAATHLPARANWQSELLAHRIDLPLSIRNCRFLI